MRAATPPSGLHTVRNYVSDAASTTGVFVLLKHKLKAVVVAPPAAEHFLALISSHIQTFALGFPQ